MSSGVRAGHRASAQQRSQASSLPLVAWLLPLFIATADSSRLIVIGDETLTAYLTVVVLVVLVLSLLGQWRAQPAAAPVPLGLRLWLLSALVTAVVLPRTDGTLQNAATYAVLVLAAARAGGTITPEHLPRLSELTDRACWVFAAGYALTLLTDGQTEAGLFGTRTGAILAVLAVAWTSSHLLALGGRAKLNRLLLPVALLAEIAVSGSRTALAVAFGVIALALIARRARSGGALAAGLFAVVGFAYLAATWSPLRERFLSGDSGIKVGSLTINTEGRAGVWDALLEQAALAPWFGHGLGYAQDVTLAASQGLIQQPHNDYLRVLVDQGSVGLGLLVFGLLVAAARILWRVARDQPEHRALHVAALGAVAAFVVFMLTDNPLVYVFAGAPTGVLLGASAGIARHVPRGVRDRQPIRLNPTTVIGVLLFLATLVGVELVRG